MLGWEYSWNWGEEKTYDFCVKISWKKMDYKIETEREDNIKMALRERGCEDDSWMELAQYLIQWLALVLAALHQRFCWK
jgi:hypothetical protein